MGSSWEIGGNREMLGDLSAVGTQDENDAELVVSGEE
jgi:hypothetical protein